MADQLSKRCCFIDLVPFFQERMELVHETVSQALSPFFFWFPLCPTFFIDSIFQVNGDLAVTEMAFSEAELDSGLKRPAENS